MNDPVVLASFFGVAPLKAISSSTRNRPRVLIFLICIRSVDEDAQNDCSASRCPISTSLSFLCGCACASRADLGLGTRLSDYPAESRLKEG
jgi:hypothetical protein